ncbi:MAG: DUF1015 domain-containing protein [Verrucomicrobiales bacterium]|nr:DUF1015 domain-containing protein [Verrucomicrobiales bacterium]MCP5525470.1 DUF1015 domain-containing protein [Verrucomicrobiales bacterium]
MAVVKPFAALRPQPELAARVCAPPYDVMTESEARRMAADESLSFIHVSRPEVQLPTGSSASSPAAYAAARSAFERMIDSGALRRDPAPGFYLYRQATRDHTQTGFVALASCEEYVRGRILKHELTRVEKEEDRVRHIECLSAQTGPAFLFHQPDATLAELARRATERAPEIDFEAADGVRHSAWSVTDAAVNGAIEQAFARLPRLYIADGHHRSAAAARVWERRPDDPAAAGFLAVIFPSDTLRILPYHRVVRDLNGRSSGEFQEQLGGVCARLPGDSPTPARKGMFALFMDGAWTQWQFRADPPDTGGAADTLDVAMLQRRVLEPLLGIENPRTSDRIDFVGGIRGTGALESLVQEAGYACAFAMFPTRIDELMAVADAGGVMPPKSTWFEPKLRDAMFIHRLGES